MSALKRVVVLAHFDEAIEFESDFQRGDREIEEIRVSPNDDLMLCVDLIGHNRRECEEKCLFSDGLASGVGQGKHRFCLSFPGDGAETSKTVQQPCLHDLFASARCRLAKAVESTQCLDDSRDCDDCVQGASFECHLQCGLFE